jgi:hypothetical protein
MLTADAAPIADQLDGLEMPRRSFAVRLTGSRLADGAALLALTKDRQAAGQVIKNLIWRAAYRRWPELDVLEPGYTMLLPVPGDMPVFLHLALANVRYQDSEHRLHVIVVPDRMTPGFAAAFAAAQETFEAGTIQLVPLDRRAQLLRRVARDDPSKNYFLQVQTGLEHVRTTHALLHDADLFIHDPSFLRRQYERCVEDRLCALGVSPCWDHWLRQHGFGHVVATWELLVDIRWMRRFAPWEHRGHHAWLDGIWHGFDVTLYTQAISGPAAVGRREAPELFEHFNWAICNYRVFHRDATGPYEDERFVLLLVRLLADALDHHTDTMSPSASLPPFHQMLAGVTDPAQPVTYLSKEAAINYPDFRRRVMRITDGPLFQADAAAQVRERLRHFGDAFGERLQVPALRAEAPLYGNHETPSPRGQHVPFPR